MAVGTLSSSAPVVVASIGACGSGGSTLLNELFQTSLPVAPRRGVQTTLGVAEAEAASSQAVVLDVEGFDSRCVRRASRRADLCTTHMWWCFRKLGLLCAARGVWGLHMTLVLVFVLFIGRTVCASTFGVRLF